MFPITFNILHIHNKNNLKFKIIFTYLTLLFILSLINIYPQNDAGVNWYYATGDSHFPVRSHHTSVVYDNKIWVIGGVQDPYDDIYLNDVWSSSDGANWTQVTSSASFGKRNEHTSVVYDNKIWVIGGRAEINDTYIYYKDVWYSTDGVEWTQATDSADFGYRSGHTSVVYDNKMWVIGGSSNDVWYSSDGVTWTQATASASFSGGRLTSVFYDNKMWIIESYAGTSSYLIDVWYSTDGVTWTQAIASAPFSTRYGYTSTVYNNKMWVIGGYSDDYIYMNDVWYSVDGVTWTQATSSVDFPVRVNHTSIVYDNKMWVIGGYSSPDELNDVWYSINGAEWTQAATIGSFPPRSDHTSVIYDNKIWVIGGYFNKNDVWYSTDGVIWTQATSSAAFPGRSGHTSIVYDNKMWVIGGYAYSDGSIYMNDVWYSTDGVTWTQATASAEFPARAGHTSVVYDDKMWVIGGVKDLYDAIYLKDVWYSTDGVNWTQATASAFSRRYGHTIIVYDNKMWVIGGSYSYKSVWNGIPCIVTVYYDDVWYSTDGVIWTEATASADFSSRSGHTSVVYDNKMWVISGYKYYYFLDQHTYMNDVWYSGDGVNWTQTTASADFPARGGHTSVVHNNKMWIIGGYKYPDGYMNDVWYSLPSTNVDGLIFGLYE